MIESRSVRERRASSFDFIQVRLASPEDIRGPKDPKERERSDLQGLRNWWSWGEVTKPDTIKYRSFQPEKDGLFCDRIFGPVVDWECRCGNYHGKRYRGVICDQCGVEVTLSKVRRERMGHIELAVPVAHIWYYRVRSVIPRLLGMRRADVEKIIYYTDYVVIDPGEQDVRVNQLLDPPEYLALRERASEQGDDGFLADIGAAAIRELLRRVDLDSLAQELRAKVPVEWRKEQRRNLLARLKLTDAFRNSGESGDVRNRPQWMILDVVPVIPPGLRPLVRLEGGRFAASDLNDLYRSIINHNNYIAELQRYRAEDVLQRNAKRQLQESVDALFDNGRRSMATRGRGKRPLTSLSALLQGKHGRFRQSLLGKRVDYSGRSIIVVGPELQLHQCGLPKVMALELFKPFIIHHLVEKGVVETVKRAMRLVDGTMTTSGSGDQLERRRAVTPGERAVVYEILEETVRDHPVLLSRAPTLHRLGIQAFEPVLVEGKAIRIHPLVCAAFNADFDGDQMAVYVPLSFEAQLEARLLMLSSNNVLKPSNGQPIAQPSQDIVLGCYFATKAPPNFSIVDQKALRRFADVAEIEMDLAFNRLALQSAVVYYIRDSDGKGGRWERTTPGRVLFNAIVPKEIGYKNADMTKKALSEIVFESYRQAGLAETVRFLDRLKEFGFTNATRSGVSIGMVDLEIPTTKSLLVKDTMERVGRFEGVYQRGFMDDRERRELSMRQWLDLFEALDDEIAATLESRDSGFSPLSLLIQSGARANPHHLRQLVGAKGFVARPTRAADGDSSIIEQPILTSLREGLNELDYFKACHGVRKTFTDHNLRTAATGHLMRRLVDVAQHVTIEQEDCGTIQGLEVSALKVGADVITPLSERVVGNFAVEDVENPHELDRTGRPALIVEAGQLIDEANALQIEEAGIERVKVRSVLTCEARRGLCRICYGRNLATMNVVDLGEAVGVVAAQSVGEPTTQLVLNAKRLGGSVQLLAKQTGVSAQMVTDVAGTVRLVDVIEGETLVINVDQRTGRRSSVILRPKSTERDPRIEIIEHGQWRDHRLRVFALPDRVELIATEGKAVSSGALLARVRETGLTVRDIGIGLPRIERLFEAGAPAHPAALADMDGTVRVGGIYKQKREVFVTADGHADSEVRRYELRPGARVLVQDGDRVRAGERLSEGPVNPHDILRIKGTRAAQEYLLDAVQEVFRLQGVRIADKHIGVIVRQMVQKVRIIEPGETTFLEGEHVDRDVFRSENDRAKKRNQAPAIAEPLLLGITKASLTAHSFISAASFQEATRALTDAAVRGARDDLLGLKENVIVGHLIPAGTGRYREMEIDVAVETEARNGLSSTDALAIEGSSLIRRFYISSNDAPNGGRSYAGGRNLESELSESDPLATGEPAPESSDDEVSS